MPSTEPATLLNYRPMSQSTVSEASDVRRGTPWWARILLYLGVIVVAVIAAGSLGAQHYEATECVGEPGGECDIAGLAALDWSIVALLVCIVAALALETLLFYRRRHHSARP